MSDYIISIVVTFVIIAVPFGLVRLLDIVCPLTGGVLTQRGFERDRHRK